MCGIAGVVNFKKSIDKNDHSYRLMLDAMANRGPDDEGVYYCEHAFLMHKRLSVIDPFASSQPMHYEKFGKEYVIVYNGELYNTEEIKSELIKKGFTFFTKGDTEVVLTAYICYGEKCLDLFNGIFAFSIWDIYNEILFFARDVMGVKPFFYHFSESEFIFASTVPTLLCHPHVTPTINSVSVSEILLLGPGRSVGNAIFTSILELPRATCGTFSKNGLTLKTYFRLEDKPHKDTFDETSERVNFLVADAIKRQMVSDVPLGTFLSGGLDSSIITAVASEEMKKRNKTLDTFSVTYKDHSKHFKASHFQPDSDEKYIELMAKHFNTNHHEIVLETDDIISSLYEAIDEKGLPSMADVDSSLIAFCKKIKEHVTVALSGECADEIFGGYPWFRDKNIRDNEGFPWAQNTLYRAEFISDGLKEKISKDYVKDKYTLALKDVSLSKDISQEEKRMREMFVLNIDHFMQTLLFRKDSCSMHASLEVRVPFCDKRITEYLYCVPWEFKNYKNREKGLLRHAFENVLPEEILWRKKSPYPKTHNPEYLLKLRDIFSPIISDKSSPLWEIVNIEKAKTLLYEERSLPWYGQLMTTPQTIAYFIQLEYWMKKYNVRLI